jgi:tetratricopeptide (TPR) repeat protein
VKKTLAAGFALLWACNVALAQAPQQPPTAAQIGVGFPGQPWTLVFDVDGFKTEFNGVQPDGRAYLEAKNSSTEVILSVLLQKVSGKATAADCEANQKVRLAQNAGLNPQKIQTRDASGMAILEYTIEEFQGVPIQQRNLFACLPKDDIYVDIHISKTQFRPEQEELLNKILNSAHFVAAIPSDQAAPAPAPLATTPAAEIENFRDGSRYFELENFSAAIAPYQKALDAEKESRSLPKNYWRVLVDNLGMAYGITGDLTHAEETFNYGLSQDPGYPMFYYNLACVAAERNDMDKTMDFLRKAFANKANSIPGESIPDPATDDSFKAFMADQRFRDFLKSL